MTNSAGKSGKSVPLPKIRYVSDSDVCAFRVSYICFNLSKPKSLSQKRSVTVLKLALESLTQSLNMSCYDNVLSTVQSLAYA